MGGLCSCIQVQTSYDVQATPDAKNDVKKPVVDGVVILATATQEATAAESDRFRKAFDSVAGDNAEIDAYELQKLLNDTFVADRHGEEFSTDLCRSMVAMKDADLSGMLGYKEAKELWENVYRWKEAFSKIDTANSGYIQKKEFEKVLDDLTLKLKKETKTCLTYRYIDKEGRVSFKDFIACMTKLSTVAETFRVQDNDDDDSAPFSLDYFVQSTMYM